MRALPVLLLVACGGAAPVGPQRARDAGEAPRELVLYRDGALVRERHAVETREGTVGLTLPLPPDVEAGGILVRIVAPGAGAARVGALTVIEPALVPGDPIEVRGGARPVRGTLRWAGARELVVEDASGVRVLLDPKHVVRPAPGRASRRVDVAIEADGAGRAELEVAYVTRGLGWVADYTLVMDGGSGRAELHGALGIANGSGVTFEDATITLVDTERPTRLTAFDGGGSGDDDAGAKRAPVADPTKPRAEQPARANARAAAGGEETPRTTLPFRVDVRPGAQSVSLIAGSVVLPARETLVYDPVGDERDHPQRIPLEAEGYGLDRTSSAVSQSVDIDLARARVPAGLPAGTVRLVERGARGDLSPLGESRIFDRAGTGADAETISPTTSVAIGRAADVEGTRTRREFSLDADAKRIVEEFEIELTNTGERAVDVIVREHLYRGRNWTLAYFSEPRTTKEGPQKIAMRTRVPAKGTARVVYRVVYWW